MSKLDRIEKIISKAVADTDITQEWFALVSNEAENYHRLNEKMNERMKKRQSGNIEKFRLIEHSKWIGIREIIEKNEGMNNGLKYQV